MTAEWFTPPVPVPAEQAERTAAEIDRFMRAGKYGRRFTEALAEQHADGVQS